MKTTPAAATITRAELITKDEEDRENFTFHPGLKAYYEIELEVDGRRAHFHLPVESWDGWKAIGSPARPG